MSFAKKLLVKRYKIIGELRILLNINLEKSIHLIVYLNVEIFVCFAYFSLKLFKKNAL